MCKLKYKLKNKQQQLYSKRQKVTKLKILLFMWI